MADYTTADAFDEGHKKGFHAGYVAACQELRQLIMSLERVAAYPDDAHILEKYHEIFRGFDNEPSEAMQEIFGGVIA